MVFNYRDHFIDVNTLFRPALTNDRKYLNKDKIKSGLTGPLVVYMINLFLDRV